ncbi:DUF2341 domain-containing protein [Pontibacter sp. G13]|uniref:DUF2341 domain-containing protein n=1 Tax=Pontibacter sp. G13 TaxID=3074898 RepID=UPI0028897D44|nr:DUF2341 domain-containing protein [Pontibacter sp. G13]WNJ16721.1 DUF2341 domain-containing protein [Pontibacter sp. G13]
MKTYWNSLLTLTAYITIQFVSTTCLKAAPTGISSAFLYSKTITIQENQVPGTDPLLNFPLLINRVIPELRTASNGGRLQNPNGYDIQFVDSNGVVLPVQIERYDATTGELVAWVQVPNISATEDTEIYLQYGNPTITDDPSGSDLWIEDNVGRWHMDADPSVEDLTDVTGMGADGVANGGMTSANRVEGIIGYANYFDGSNDYFQIGGNIVLEDSFTLSVWIKSAQVNNQFHGILGNQRGSTTRRSPSLWVREQNRIHGGFGDGTAWRSWITPDSVISNNEDTWHLLTSTFDGTNYRLYVDGKEVYNDTRYAGLSPTNSRMRWIGRVDNYFRGAIDEVSFYQTTLDSSWIQTMFNSQNDPTTFVEIEVERTLPLTWLGIEATREGTQSRIEWTTTDEINNSHFVIEKRSETGEFISLGKLAAHPHPQTLNYYQFHDFHPGPAAIQYRVKQVDMDGQFSYSSIVEIAAVSHREDVQVYPNPSNGPLHVSITGWDEHRSTEVTIWDLSGRLVARTDLSNLGNATLQLEGIDAGTYLLRASNGSQNHQQMIQLR